MPRIVSLAIMMILIVILGMTFFRVVAPFFLPLFLAAMTAIVCQPLYRYFLRRTKHHLPLAAGLTTGTILAAGLIPFVTGTLIASLQLYTFAADINSDSARPVLKKAVTMVVDGVNRYRPANQQLEVNQVTADVSAWIRSSLTEIGDKSLGKAAGTTLGLLTGFAGMAIKTIIALLVFGIALFYFFADGTKLVEAAETLIPVNVDYQRQLLEEFAKVVRSVVVATFLAALAQGVATTLAIGVLGFHHLVALLALATFAALIPLAGTWLVWVPCVAWLYMHNHPIQATILALYCIIFVGFLDNVIRTYVLNSSTKLHPLLAFISVLGGIEAMGLWGVFIGPIVACCLHALVKIFNLELVQLSRDHWQNDGSSGPLVASSEVPVASFSENPADSEARDAETTDRPKKESETKENVGQSPSA